MKKLNMYCLSTNPNNLDIIQSLNYIPVGLGEKTFSKEWLRDNTGNNISKKNKYYGEYTFHYWLWKNYLNKIDESWIGFCQYRKFWALEYKDKNRISLNQLKDLTLNTIPNEYNDAEVILGNLSSINEFKPMKFFKRGLKLILKKPSYFFSSKKRNIKFHFDLWHGENNLSKAIELLDKENRQGFEDFVNNNTSFNPQNMFICRSKKILNQYYETIFPWLKKCEEIFGFENLSGYGLTRIYGFLAERFMSYWFQKYTKYKTMPIIFYDITNDSS